MRIAIVGPTHPYKGGIAQHTTRLAHQLAAAGHDVYVESWRNQYPKRLYPGVLTVPEGRPEIPVYPRVQRRLSWNRPDSWLAAGRRLRTSEMVIFVVASTVQIVPYLAMLRVLRGSAQTVALMHNVLPHEPKPWDRRLVTALVGSVDDVLVHSAEQRATAAALAPSAAITTAVLPANLEGATRAAPRTRTDVDEPLEVLAFGLVRPYKGVDLLVEGAAAVPQVRVTVAGEFWTPVAELEDLADRHGMRDRLTLRPGYVPTEELADLFGRSDLVALTYRSVTGSGNIKLAFEHGRPVIATRVGTLPDEVAGRYGVVCEPEADDIARALRAACDPATYNDLTAAVGAYPRGHLMREWEAYVAAVETLGRRRP